GHDVVVFDKDDVRPGALDEVASRGPRTGAPHAVQAHAFLARARLVLRERLPDVLASLYDEGVGDLPLPPPPSLAGRDDVPADPDLVFLMVRRSVAEWALRRAAANQVRLQVHSGEAVTGLRVTEAAATATTTGVVLASGDVHGADIVIDASGRRSMTLDWLPVHVRSNVAASSDECGMVYFSRHYRLAPGAVVPPLNRGFAAGVMLPRFTALLIPSDNGHVIVAITPLAADTQMKAIRDPATFDAVLRSIPAIAPWLDVLEPTSDVFAMGGLQSTLVRLVVDGTAAVHGLHVVGDACSTTNPTFGRGMSWALAHAAVVASAIREHPDDLDRQAKQVDAWIAAEVAPFHADAVATDRARVAVMRQAAFGDEPPAPQAAGDPKRPSFPQVMAASFTDPVVWHRLSRYQSLLATPRELFDDEDIRQRVAAATSTGAHGATPPAAMGPSNEALTALLGEVG
ncbi:MAG: hypothetical protein QOC60_496, partial [Frankiaceae bacterium]|nr:hypothetical protein [Frankiaceae bacterium]